MSETPFFFDHDGTPLFGVLYEPNSDPNDSAAEPRDRAIAFCPAFAEEAAIAQRVCVEFARSLAGRGYHVLRFDYRGTGDSGGDFENATLESRMSDIRAAVELLRTRYAMPVGLFGLRLGATLAALVAAADPEIESLLLWEPVTHLKNHLKNFLRMQVVTQNALAGKVAETQKSLLDRLDNGQTVDILGYPLTPACSREFTGRDVLAEIGGSHGPTLIAAIGRQQRQRRDLRRMVEAYESRGSRVDFIHAQEQSFWIDPADPWREMGFWHGHEELFRLSADWLDRIGTDK
ncbi:MAG: alpha/beta hydrolase [Thermoguttaceae bacterium]